VWGDLLRGLTYGEGGSLRGLMYEKGLSAQGPYVWKGRICSGASRMEGGICSGASLIDEEICSGTSRMGGGNLLRKLTHVRGESAEEPPSQGEGYLLRTSLLRKGGSAQWPYVLKGGGG